MNNPMKAKINGPRKHHKDLRERDQRKATVSVSADDPSPQGRGIRLFIDDTEREKMTYVYVNGQELRTAILDAVGVLESHGGEPNTRAWGLPVDYPKGSLQQQARAALEIVREIRRTLTGGIGYASMLKTKDGDHTIQASSFCGLYRIPDLVDRALAVLEDANAAQELVSCAKDDNSE